MSTATIDKPPASVIAPIHRDKPRVILSKNLTPSGHRYGRMEVTMPVGFTIEDAMKPECWANVAHQFRKVAMTNDPDQVGTILELRTEDHAFYAELYIRAVNERSLTVAILREPVYFGPAAVKSAGFETRWNVGKRGFDVLRKSDRQIVADAASIKTREQAQDWIDKTVGPG